MRLDQAGIDGADDELFKRLPTGEVEGLLERGIAEGWGTGVHGCAVVLGEGQQGELAELKTLGVVEGGEPGGRGVRRVGAMAEYLEEGEVRRELV